VTPHALRDIGANGLEYDNDFWHFSLAVYDRREVARECLTLQESIGIDVNLLLFCAWIGTRAIALSRPEIEEASGAVVSWHENVVRSLRGARQQIKALYGDGFESLLTKVKGVEIEAEKIEQAMLFAISKQLRSRAGGDHRDAVAGNIKNYIELKANGASAPEISAPCLIAAAISFVRPLKS
jgi:uncharacterized protein (TIGR02444 family)